MAVQPWLGMAVITTWGLVTALCVPGETGGSSGYLKLRASAALSTLGLSYERVKLGAHVGMCANTTAQLPCSLPQKATPLPWTTCRCLPHALQSQLCQPKRAGAASARRLA